MHPNTRLSVKTMPTYEIQCAGCGTIVYGGLSPQEGEMKMREHEAECPNLLTTRRLNRLEGEVRNMHQLLRRVHGDAESP